jgi:long-chain acyl-CoA synthetase
LLVANHQSYFDAPVLYRARPWRRRLATCSATATEPFAPYFTEGGTVAGRAWGGFKWLLVALAFHAFPMPRAAGFRRSLGRAAELVGGGLDVLVFPEGRMSRTDEMQAFRGGIGILATELGVPVVPIRLKGLREVYPVGAPRPAPGPVEVVIGPPLRFDAGEDRAAVARRLKDAVAGL